MSQIPPIAPQDPPPHIQNRELIRALSWVFGGTLLLALAQLAIPLLASVSQVILALLLLEVPLRVLRGQAPVAPPGALTLGPWWPGLRLALLSSLIIFPLFIGGFDLAYRFILDREATWTFERTLRWSEDLEDRPADPCVDGQVAVWARAGTISAAVPKGSPFTLALTTPPSTTPLRVRSLTCTPNGLRMGAPLPIGDDGLVTAPPGSGLIAELGDRRAFQLAVQTPRGPLPASQLRLGARGVTASDDGQVDGQRGLGWLLAYLAIHLGLVAYPEEYFFRGYLMRRLDALLGTPRRLFGVAVGWGLPLSALAFALLHPILIPGAHRLLVFFPALLFGWLARRQGSLGAAVVVHALSNVCLAIVSRMYT